MKETKVTLRDLMQKHLGKFERNKVKIDVKNIMLTGNTRFTQHYFSGFDMTFRLQCISC